MKPVFFILVCETKTTTLVYNKRFLGSHTSPVKRRPWKMLKCSFTLLPLCCHNMTFPRSCLAKSASIKLSRFKKKARFMQVYEMGKQIFIWTFLFLQLKQQGFCPKSHERFSSRKIQLKKDTRSFHWNQVIHCMSLVKPGWTLQQLIVEYPSTFCEVRFVSYQLASIRFLKIQSLNSFKFRQKNKFQMQYNI